MTCHSDPVIVIVPVTREMRLLHRLSADARLAVTERFQGAETVLCTDDECPFGVAKAARAWAEATGAAFREAA